MKIADFGFAKYINKQTNRTYTLCGTPEYLAPEILNKSSQGYGISVDWWSMGILLYEMLVGETPFFDVNPMGIYRQIVKGYFKVPSFVGEEAKDLIKGLLKVNV